MMLAKFSFTQVNGHKHQDLSTSASTPNSLRLLRQQIQLFLKDGYPSVAQVAEAAGMSIRSLQRQLAKEQLNYTLLVEQVRFETAVHLLQDPTLKLIDIALELGYSDAANFTRAFKRWAGISPNRFRDLHIKF